MRLYIDVDECGPTNTPHVDRSGTAQVPYGPEGFIVYLSGLTVEFEDERGAAELAKAILRRLGEWPKEEAV